MWRHILLFLSALALVACLYPIARYANRRYLGIESLEQRIERLEQKVFPPPTVNELPPYKSFPLPWEMQQYVPSDDVI